MGGHSIACINARDRNVLGFHRDLLTATAYGVREFLFVYGDRPETGTRSDDLTVQSMIADARQFAHRPDVSDGFRIGVTTGLRPIATWKHEADFLLTQVTFSAPDLNSLAIISGLCWSGLCGRYGPAECLNGEEAVRRDPPARRPRIRHQPN